MTFEYQLDAGKYVFNHPRAGRIEAGEEVGLHIDLSSGMLLKHGRPDLVETHYKVLHGAFIVAGRTQDAADLVYVKGRFDVEELNKMLSIHSYAGRFYREKIASGQAGARHDDTY